MPRSTEAEISSRANAPSSAEPSSISATLASTWPAVTAMVLQAIGTGPVDPTRADCR